MSASKGVSVAKLDSLFQRLEKKYPRNSGAIAQFHVFAKAFFQAEPCGVTLPELDESLFNQGKPFFAFDAWDVNSLKLPELLRQKLPELQEALPDRADDLRRFSDMLETEPECAGQMARLVLDKKLDGMGDIVKKSKIPSDLAYFILFSLLQARAREIAHAAAPVLEGKAWAHGHCPVCGSPAKFSYLGEPNGARYLVCSLCEHQYRFARTTCPYCENSDPGNITVHFLPDYPEDRAEACTACQRFILASDLRGRPGDAPLAAFIPCSLVHLDIMMLKSEFTLGCES